MLSINVRKQLFLTILLNTLNLFNTFNFFTLPTLTIQYVLNMSIKERLLKEGLFLSPPYFLFAIVD